jgi:hypothetical protein
MRLLAASAVPQRRVVVESKAVNTLEALAVRGRTNRIRGSRRPSAPDRTGPPREVVVTGTGTSASGVGTPLNDEVCMRTLTSDDWHERGVDYHQVADPSWEQVEAAIRSLDGCRHTDVTLTSPVAPGGTIDLAVGGGNEGHYSMISDLITPDDIFGSYFIDPSRPEQPWVELVVGGQGVGYPSFLIASLPTVLQAARYFLDTGELDPVFTWVEELPEVSIEEKYYDDRPF